MGFSSGLKLLLSSNTEDHISTGSPELDLLIGKIQKGMFYLFYGEKFLIKTLFQHITVNALKPHNPEAPRVVYLLMGNYRRERTQIETEQLIELIEASGLYMEEALKRMYIITASSADQQTLLVEELEKLLESEENISLVLARGIFKLHRDDARHNNRHVVREEVQRSIMKMRQLCGVRGIPIVASARSMRGIQLSPLPESSSFLRHLANIIVYLRSRDEGTLYNRASLITHPARSPSSTEYTFKVNKELGRDTPPFRQSFQKMVNRLRREFQEALISLERRDAFDELVDAWSSELGAMTYAEFMKLQDLLFMVALVDNRRLISKLEEKHLALSEKMRDVLQQLESLKNDI